MLRARNAYHPALPGAWRAVIKKFGASEQNGASFIALRKRHEPVRLNDQRKQ
jgi:hypothetical protein